MAREEHVVRAVDRACGQLRRQTGPLASRVRPTPALEGLARDLEAVGGWWTPTGVEDALLDHVELALRNGDLPAEFGDGVRAVRDAMGDEREVAIYRLRRAVHDVTRHEPDAPLSDQALRIRAGLHPSPGAASGSVDPAVFDELVSEVRSSLATLAAPGDVGSGAVQFARAACRALEVCGREDVARELASERSETIFAGLDPTWPARVTAGATDTDAFFAVSSSELTALGPGHWGAGRVLHARALHQTGVASPEGRAGWALAVSDLDAIDGLDERMQGSGAAGDWVGRAWLATAAVVYAGAARKWTKDEESARRELGQHAIDHLIRALTRRVLDGADDRWLRVALHQCPPNLPEAIPHLQALFAEAQRNRPRGPGR